MSEPKAVPTLLCDRSNYSSSVSLNYPKVRIEYNLTAVSGITSMDQT
ncbi:hypothetical protein [Nostoc sp. TCL240-02]|nr:hypothetical protein [Nostoc sp. TCL240-02]